MKADVITEDFSKYFVYGKAGQRKKLIFAQPHIIW